MDGRTPGKPPDAGLEELYALRLRLHDLASAGKGSGRVKFCALEYCSNPMICPRADSARGEDSSPHVHSKRVVTERDSSTSDQSANRQDTSARQDVAPNPAENILNAMAC